MKQDAIKQAMEALSQLVSVAIGTEHGEKFQVQVDAGIAAIKALNTVREAEQITPSLWERYHDNQKQPQEPAQAVPVYEYRIKNVHFKNWSPWEECEKSEYDQYRANPKDADGWMHETRTLYTVPPAIDDDTKKMVLELCTQVIRNSGEHEHIPGTVESMAAEIIDRLGAGK